MDNNRKIWPKKIATLPRKTYTNKAVAEFFVDEMANNFHPSPKTLEILRKCNVTAFKPLLDPAARVEAIKKLLRQDMGLPEHAPEKILVH